MSAEPPISEVLRSVAERIERGPHEGLSSDELTDLYALRLTLVRWVERVEEIEKKVEKA